MSNIEKMQFKTPDEREKLNKLRAKQLKLLRKGKGPGRPKKPRTRLSREQLNTMRDEKLNEISNFIIV